MYRGLSQDLMDILYFIDLPAGKGADCAAEKGATAT